MTHLALRVVYANEGTPSKSGDPQHFVVLGGGRNCVNRWVLSLSGNILHHESTPNTESAVDFLATDKGGDCVVTFERRKVLIHDEDLNVRTVLRYGKEIPTSGEFVYSLEDGCESTRRRARYFICCFESGLVAVRLLLVKDP